MELNNQLILAARNGQFGKIRQLLKQGADPNYNNSDALQWSAREGHAKIVGLLLQSGANRNAADNNALKWAKRNNHPLIVRMLERLKILVPNMECSQISEEWIKLNDENLKKHPFVVLYTWKFDEIINGGLRSQLPFTALMQSLINKILLALEDAPPFPTDVCFLRGFGQFQLFEKLDIGQEIILQGFNSLTCSKDVALIYYGGENTAATVCFPKGTKFLYLEDFSLYSDEQELLTFPNSIWEFEGFTELGITYSELDQIPEAQTRADELEDYTFHFQYKGADLENFASDVDFDYRFLFFLSEASNQISSIHVLYNWPDKYLDALKNKMDFIKLTDLMGYSKDFQVPKYDNMIEIYQNFILEIASRFFEIPPFEFSDTLPQRNSREPFNFLPQKLFQDLYQKKPTPDRQKKVPTDQVIDKINELWEIVFPAKKQRMVINID